ncbi:MAG: cache domain-containing protein, partial [Pseudomonadota bacterium]
ALLPLVVLMPLLLGVTMWRWIDKFDELMLAKVASDLRIAEQYLHRIEATQAAEISALAKSADFANVRNEGGDLLEQFLLTTSREMGLDFLALKRPAAEELASSLMAISQAASAKNPAAGLALLERSELENLGEGLAEAAALPLVQTQAARDIDRQVEERGMMLLAAHRIGSMDEVLIGGRLLNRNLDFIDTLNDLIYRAAEDEEMSRTGTTTLFLDDVRISTNVRLFEGSRALGTRVSEVVWQQVMVAGNTWLDRAFVVNDWYISGYQPIADVTGQRIGMLYTGFLEAPFGNQRTTTILTLIIAFLAVCGFSVPVFLHLARGVFRPLEQMTATMARAEAGELDARIGSVRSQDEIGAVARHLDRLLDQVQDRDERLRQSAESLNELVEKRTEELQETNRQLESTFAQLVAAEKLATVGEITAGVAHEINNPVTVIQGNLEVLRAELGSRADEHQVELDLIDQQTDRIFAIVAKLLDFSRPAGHTGEAEVLDPNSAMREALMLVSADLRNRNIEVIEQLNADGTVCMVKSELLQVLVNLLVNAAQAMETGGRVTVAAEGALRNGRDGVELTVKDNGVGIDLEALDSVFDPFFTTKLAKGTGLGLSISQALITQAGGKISVENNKNCGARFLVWLPLADNLSAAAE